MNQPPTPLSQTKKLTQFIRLDPQAALPLAVQLQQQITWLIAGGELAQGDRLPPIRELAQHLDINMHTVWATYQKLKTAGLVTTRQGRGTVVLLYDPARTVHQAPDLPSFTIGVLIPDFNPFYIPFIRGVEETVRETPWLLLICNSHDSSTLAERAIHQMMAKQVDGLILASPGLVVRDKMASKEAGLPPVVYVDELHAPDYTILLDSEGAGYRATTHLAEHGHRRIGLITGPIEWLNIRECYLGYQRALTSASLNFQPEFMVEVPAITIECGYQAAQQLLNQSNRPSAIFADADLLAIGAMQAIKAHGLSVPQDIAVVGYNNIDLAALVEPALTTVAAPAYAMGVAAMTMLQQLLAKQPVERKRVLLATDLVIRRSCGCQM